MRPLRAASLVVVTLLLAATAAAQWSHVGIARLPGACDQPLGPSRGELFAVLDRMATGEMLSNTQYCVDGVPRRTRVDWDERTGAWQVTGLWGVGSDVLLVTMTTWPDPAISPLAQHHGILLVDAQPGLEGWLHENRAQEIARPMVFARAGINDVAWAPPVLEGPGGGCDVGGEGTHAFFVGWNVYRLLRGVVPPDVSTPDHYLCGPDLDCSTTADNGFVAHVPYVLSSDGLFHFEDVVPDDPVLADYVYVVQPVRVGAPTGDANADTIPDEDLNGDGVPEFVDPSGSGRGLTARVVGGPLHKPILVSPDSFTLRPAPLRILRSGGTNTASWEPLGPGAPAVFLDLHAGALTDLRDRVAFAARDRLACDLPAGPSSVILADPAAGNRYYLLSIAWSTGTGYAEDYGTDSFGVARPATTTLPACR